MSIPNKLVNHYPWLPSLKIYYSDLASKEPIKFITEVFAKGESEEIKERLLKLFNAAFENLEEITEYKVDHLNVYVYLLLKIFLYALNNKIITNRIANLYSKVAYNELERENNDSNLYDICLDLGLKIKYYDPPLNYGTSVIKDQRQKLESNFTIHFIDYLRLASNLRDEIRKLAHNSLSKGYVFIQNKRLIRLLQEYVRNKIIIKETDDKVFLKAFIKEVLEIKDFKDLYDKILEEWALRKEEIDFSFKLDFSNKGGLLALYPPCVTEILKNAQEGQNLAHHERLFITWFLLALEYPVEDVVNIFSPMPDFNKEIATYQVKFAKKKAYVPYQCSTIKSLNFCMAEKYKDEICLEGYGAKDPKDRKKMKHPLSYVRLKQYRAAKEIEYFKNRPDKKTKEKEELKPDTKNE